jgi:hypothetical protein
MVRVAALEIIERYLHLELLAGGGKLAQCFREAKS